MKYAVVAIALLTAQASAQDAPRFTMEPRPDLDWVTVPVIRPVEPNQPVALDVIPNGKPADRGIYGAAWIHVCDSDIGSRQMNCALVAAGDKAVRFGSSNFGEPARPIEFVVGNKVVGTITTRETIRIGAFDSAAVLRKIDALLEQNHRQQAQIRDLHRQVKALRQRVRALDEAR